MVKNFPGVFCISVLHALIFMPIFARSKTISIVNLIVDIGNTIAKVALFDGEAMVNVIYDSNQSLDCLENICIELPSVCVNFLYLCSGWIKILLYR